MKAFENRKVQELQSHIEKVEKASKTTGKHNIYKVADLTSNLQDLNKTYSQEGDGVKPYRFGTSDNTDVVIR